MSFDLRKDNQETKYYYTQNGKTMGPCSLPDLLKKVDSDTLVYRDGIEWTNAKEVKELSPYFNQSAKRINWKRIIIGVFLVLVVLTVFLLLFYKSSDSRSKSNLDGPITAKVYANVKKRNKLVVGSISVPQTNRKFKQCLRHVFGDKIIKASSYANSKDALKDMQNNETDILLLRRLEIKEFQDVLDISDPIVLEGYDEDVYIAIPKNNNTHLDNIFNCLKN
jgi:hypothetical protein